MKLAAQALLLALVFLLSGCASDYGAYGPGAGNFSTVIVDAGHGGGDRGARALSGKHEKLLTLDTAHRLASILRSRGYRVIETRRTEVFIPLSQRTDISNAQGNAIFVSIHYNWARRRGAHGIETYYNSAKSRRLAANIQKQLLKVYGATNRGVINRGFYVLRKNRRPAVLCELGFVSSPEDNRYIQNPAYRQRLAQAIANGIAAEAAGRTP